MSVEKVFYDRAANEFRSLKSGDDIVSSESPVEETFDDVRKREGLFADQIVVALGSVSAGDGGGKEFYWDPSSTASDNDDTVLKPDDINPGDPGRWRSYFDVYTRGEVDAQFQPKLTYLEADDNNLDITSP